MPRISKKQRSTLKEIDRLTAATKHDRLIGVVAVLIMVLLIILFNTLGYNLGIIDPNNVAIRAMMYITALVIAGFSGIKLMNASKKQRQIDGLRQQVGISKEILDAWRRGEIE